MKEPLTDVILVSASCNPDVSNETDISFNRFASVAGAVAERERMKTEYSESLGGEPDPEPGAPGYMILGVVNGRIYHLEDDFHEPSQIDNDIQD